MAGPVSRQENGRGPFRAPSRYLAWAIGCALVTLLAVTPAQGSVPEVHREFLDSIRPLQGNRIRICVHSAGLMAGFERAVAGEIAGALLVEAELYEFETMVQPPPLDYLMQLSDEELLILLTNHCDALIGISLVAGEGEEWLTYTRAYLETPYTLVARADRGYTGLLDVPRGEAIGARAFSLAQIRLGQYLRASGLSDARWRQLPYSDNRLLLDRVYDGSIAAALVWEPAYLAYLKEREDAGGVLESLPVSMLGEMTVRFGLVLRADNVFLRIQLDEAISALAEEGVFRKLAREYNLVR